MSTQFCWTICKMTRGNIQSYGVEDGIQDSVIINLKKIRKHYEKAYCIKGLQTALGSSRSSTILWNLKLWYFYWNAQFAIGRDSLARSFTYVQNMTKFLSFQEKSIENMVVAISGKICVFNNCFLLSWTSLLLPFSHDNSASFAIFSYVVDIYAVIRFFHLNTKSNY